LRIESSACSAGARIVTVEPSLAWRGGKAATRLGDALMPSVLFFSQMQNDTAISR